MVAWASAEGTMDVPQFFAGYGGNKGQLQVEESSCMGQEYGSLWVFFSMLGVARGPSGAL